MADTHGNPADPLMAALAERPWAFDFYRAVRLLECQRPELPRMGFSISPAEDPVRFLQKPSFRFAPSSLDSFQPGGSGVPPRMAVNFFGLFGPNAPLPPHITEYVLERELHFKDPTITAFFNLFTHRLLSLYYRAWAANQKVVDMDRPRDQRYATYIGAVFGIGMDSLSDRDAVPDAAKLFFSGRLSAQTRNAEGLEAILREYFAIPAEVQPFAGRWLNLPGDSLCRLGQSADSGCLGVNTILGQRFWDSQLSFRMKFGPMKLEDYERMLPKGDSFERLKHWVLNYCGEHFFWDAQLVLEAGEVPAARLGSTGVGALSVDDLTDLPSLAAKLSGPARAGGVSHNLWNRLKPATQAKLRDCIQRFAGRGQGQGIGMGLGVEGGGASSGASAGEMGTGLAAGKETGSTSDFASELAARLAAGGLLEDASGAESGLGIGLGVGPASGSGSGFGGAGASAAAAMAERIPWDIRQAIVEDINRVLRDGLLQDSSSVDFNTLSRATRELIARNPGQADFPSVNRRMLEDAFPSEISRHRKPGGLGWTTWLKTKNFSRDADDLILNPPPD